MIDMNLSHAWQSFQGMINSAIAALPNIVVALIVFALFLFGAKLTKRLIRRFTERLGRSMNVGLVMGRLAQAVVILLGVLVALSIIIPTFKAGDLLALLGIGGVAIGFAFRDILQNFLAGILILMTEPFKIGDKIMVGDYEGSVEAIETRATFIRTYDGRRVVIPNADIFTESVTVNTAFDKRRIEFDVGIGYDDDIEQAQEAILEAMKSVEGVLSDPAPDARTSALADSSVNIRVRWWIESDGNFAAIKDRAIIAVKKRLTGEGFDIPFPIRTVLFHNQSEELIGTEQTGARAVAGERSM